LGAADLAEGFGLVEYAYHRVPGEDLQQWVGEHVAGLPGVFEDSAGEFVVGGVDALSVGGGGAAADVFAGLESLVVLGELVQSQQPFLEGVFVGESGIVGA
jgi:hypothetical protein